MVIDFKKGKNNHKKKPSAYFKQGAFIVRITFYELFFFFGSRALLILFAAATATTAYDYAKDAKEEETVRKPKVIVKVLHSKKFATDEETDDAGQHQQSAEGT